MVMYIKQTEKGLIYLPSYAKSEYSNIPYEENDTFDILFAGNIGPAQSCETIVECAKYLREYGDIKFHMVGDGLSRESCETLAQKYDLKNYVFYGYHEISKMPEFYKMADSFIITMVNNEVVNSTLPAKIQSYMLAGKPVFGAISGEVKDAVKEADCGICTESGNAKELARIIKENYNNKELLHTWGQNGVKYYTKYFEKETCMNDLIKVFKDVIKQHRNTQYKQETGR